MCWLRVLLLFLVSVIGDLQNLIGAAPRSRNRNPVDANGCGVVSFFLGFS